MMLQEGYVSQAIQDIRAGMINGGDSQNIVKDSRENLKSRPGLRSTMSQLKEGANETFEETFNAPRIAIELIYAILVK